VEDSLDVENKTGSTAPRPVFAGCFGMVVVAVLGIGAVVFVFLFTNSASNTGEIVLRPADSYRLGAVEFISDNNFYVVQLPGTGFLALADMDATNRAAQGRRCRVGIVAANDPTLPGLLERYASNLSAEAAGTTLVFREDCTGGVFDATGRRLNGEGPNLDRFATRVNSDGDLVVNMSRRECSEAGEGGTRTEVRCLAVSQAGLPQGD
jgi:hypothetical protein